MASDEQDFHPEPRMVRVKRRLISIPRNVLILVVLTVLFPVLLALAAAVDGFRWLIARTPFMASRLLIVAWVFLAAEMVGLVRFFGSWITSGFGLNKKRLVATAWPVQAWWARVLLGTIRSVFGLKFEVEGEDLIAPGPILAMFRHASIVDNLLPAVYATDRKDMKLRWVMKQELLMLPSLDVGGNRLPNYFVDRESKDSRAEVRRIRALAENLGSDEGVLIFPEGTRFTEAKRSRALEKLAESNAVLHARALHLQHLLPPRLGGPLILLDAGLDVVLCGHEGLGGFAHIRDLWSGGLVGRTVSIKFWRVAAVDIPADRSARIEWLFDQWQTIDDWIAEKHIERGAAAATA